MSNFLIDSKRVAKLLVLSLILISCKQASTPKAPPAAPGGGGGNDSSSQNPPSDKFVFEPLAWDLASNPAGKDWSDFLFMEIDLNGSALLTSNVSDAELFCPRYSQLSRNEKINFWGMLISGMTKYESNFIPTMRYVETTMGKDPITGSQVASEGLLQLSYQDVQAYPYCNEFNWEKDKSLGLTDPRKTIFDPYKNLRCGMKILNQQISKKKEITVSSGAYWAVILEGGRYQQINNIAAITKRLSFCR
jgi:hypothetical protein